MDLSQPLSDEEFDELDRFLVSEGTPDDCMDISMLDGFLTAIVIGPNLIPPSQWLPLVWGETPEHPMRWESSRQAERMTGLVMRHMNDIVWLLKEDPDHYEPILLERDHAGKTVTVIDEWCMGFIEGTLLDDEAWAPLFDSNESDIYLQPMMLYGTEPGWKELERNPELEQRHGEFVESLASRVLAIRDYWLPGRKAKATIRHAQPIPGRNDPCPCGSGKKFKKCCGSAAKPN
jgi:uncharacterized protein